MTKITIESPIIRKLYEELKEGKLHALDMFWNEVEKNGAPLIEKIEDDEENFLVTPLWRAVEPIDNVCVIGEMFGMDTDDTKFEHLLNTDLWYRTWKVRGDAQSVYCFVINDSEKLEWDDLDFRLDPFNKDKYICIEDEKLPDDYYLMLKEESLVSLPNVKENEWTIEKDDTSKGKVQLFDNFESKILNNKRRVWVYTPSGYDKNGEPYGLAVFTDGWEYVNVTKTPIVLDNLIAAGKIPPMCAVFIETHDNRDTELTCSEDFSDFLTEEVIPWIHENYNITRDREKNLLGGFSYGGLTSAFIGLKHPDLFRNLLCQSSAFYWRPKNDKNEKGLILRDYEKSPKLPLNFYVTFGEFEKEAEEHYKANIDFANILESKGYNFEYKEFIGGHTNMDVTIELANGLMYLLGGM